ncbi:MAG: GDP-mannose 4,6-dehydratase [Candidatus Kerfeldbacteria bacterium]|nr:GDP-mannose 4,6-dehydratase [Candidatus Kerfeldbacteria bacterium]
MSTIFLTGGAGFIGSFVAEKLLGRGDTVVCVDDFNDYYDVTLKEARVEPFTHNPNFTLYRKDIRDLAAMKEIFAKHRIDKVCHLAARAGVRASIKDPLLYTEVNVDGTTNLLECCRIFNVKHFIFASTSSVYGNNKKIPFSEDDPVDHPISPYAATKKATELIAHTYSHLFGIRCIGLRFFTVYGPKGRPDMAAFLFADGIMNGTAIQVFNHGNMERDFTYIDDIVDGVLRSIDADELRYEIINLGNSHTVKLTTFIELIERGLGKTANKEFCEMQPGDVPKTHADITKAQRLLGWQPHTKIEKGIEHFIQWYVNEYKRS